MYPVVPRRQRLRFLYWLTALDGSEEPELRMLPALISGREVAIDVGANVGFYALRMSGLFTRVYAFEINDDLTHDLAAANPGNIEIIHVGLSSEAGQAVLYIPILNGMPLPGWASLAPNNCPDTSVHQTKPVEIRTLDSFNIESVSFIKIDVEGHELHVLRGATRTLSTHRPTILVEIKTENLDAVFRLLSELDYVRHVPGELNSHPASENHLFVPKKSATNASQDDVTSAQRIV
ncbi:MAG TPA: FkbM family methyltransferase [Chthoniobacterales bacterium]